MALIKCPHCGKEVSSYAKRCPGCGNTLTPAPMVEFGKVVCPECGFHYEKTIGVCPSCGEPNPNSAKPASHDSENQNTVVDFSKIINIQKDEFEGTTSIFSQYGMSGNPELDSLCEQVYAVEPRIVTMYSSSQSERSFGILYDEGNLLEVLKDKRFEEELRKLDSPCRGIIITLDGDETIKLNVEESDGGISIFPIDQEQFLKCCNAHNLEFKVFKQEGNPIVIRGSKEGEELMISSFQALYAYVVDKSMFPDAAAKIQRWLEADNARWKAETARLETESARLEAEIARLKAEEGRKEARKNGGIGTILIIIGVVLAAISFIDFYELYLLFIIGFTVVLTGIPFVIYSSLRKKGYNKTDAMNRMFEIINKFGR